MPDLTTTAAVKGWAKVTSGADDASIAGIIEAVSAWLIDRVGHDYSGDTVTAEIHSAPQSGAVVLAKPAASIQAVRISGTVILASGYELASERLVHRLGGGQPVAWTAGSRHIQIDYTTTEGVPADLELAAREASAFMLKQSGLTHGGSRMGLSAQANADTGSADYFVQKIGQLPMVVVALNRYRAFV